MITECPNCQCTVLTPDMLICIPILVCAECGMEWPSNEEPLKFDDEEKTTVDLHCPQCDHLTPMTLDTVKNDKEFWLCNTCGYLWVLDTSDSEDDDDFDNVRYGA